MGYSPQGRTESETTEATYHTHTHTHTTLQLHFGAEAARPEEGKANSKQIIYSFIQCR